MKATAAFSLVFLAFTLPLAGQQTPLSSNVIFEQTKAATVVILAGQGAGRLQSIATGVLITPDGVILTHCTPSRKPSKFRFARLTETCSTK